MAYADGTFTSPKIDGQKRTAFPFIDAQSPSSYPRTIERNYVVAQSSFTPAGAARTSIKNNLTYSDAIDNAAWTKTNLTATADQFANPADGAVTVDQVLESNATGEHKISRSFTFPTAEAYSLTCVAKPISRSWLRLLANDGTQDFEGWFNTSTAATQAYAPIISPTLNNGGFETAGGGGADAFASWTESTTGAGCTIVRDTSVFYRGTASMKLTSDGFDYGGVYQSGILTIGRKYKVTFYAKCTATNDYTVGIYGGAVNSATQITDTWAQYSATFVAASSVFSILPTVNVLTSPSCWIDDVTVTPLEPTCLITPDAGGSAVRNGGFETAGAPLGSWTATSTGTGAVTRDTVTFDTGTASAKLAVTTGGDLAYIYQTGLLQVGRSYRVDYKAKRGAAGSVTVHDGSTIQSTQALTASWAWYSVEFVATGTQMTFQNSTASSAVYIDQVCLTPTESPTLTIVSMPYPGNAFCLCSMAFYPRASAGTVTLGLSGDGESVSYAGDTAKGAGIWRVGLYASSSIASQVACESSAITQSAPATDYIDNSTADSAADVFAYLVSESEPQPVGGGYLRYSRKYARIPGQQIDYSSRLFTRPDMNGLKSGSTYAATLDGGNSIHLWTSRKSVIGYTSTQGTTVNNTLPSGTCTVTLSSAASATFNTTDSQATMQTALNALKGSSPSGLSNVTVIKASDSSQVVIYFGLWVGGPTVSSVTGPSGTETTLVSGSATIKAFGSTITPDTKLVQCPSHGAGVGSKCAIWNGDTLVAVGSVAGVSDSNYLTLVLSDLNSPDFNFTHLAFASGAAYRYSTIARELVTKETSDFYLPGVSIAYGSLISSGADIPLVTTYTSGQGWLDQIVASASYVAISVEIAPWLGPIIQRKTTYVKMSDALESISVS